MWKERKKKERIMPSLVATTSALARKLCVSTHYVRTNKLIILIVNIFIPVNYNKSYNLSGKTTLFQLSSKTEYGEEKKYDLGITIQ